ncbi:penicillin-binding protein 1A [Virgibacillus natechei]|uniref:Penicillin-binding protein 1A n=1 Tax=Virgibacillus natechei TaxID=1216297 RepID=A0ABS4IFD7_9BACI|nr:PBP1A family penicillin-binding protein [Virgibacillus natechei]MBP1969578.1 penicillin-binding protein 1A [Virgibacillus natechei]UZD14806.1 PBP1A family penicillin-binding protein [Virgibacillus natechei]
MADNSQSRTARRKQKKSKKKPVWKKILLTVLLVILAIGIGVGGVFTYWIATAPELDASELAIPFSSIIYDQDGNEFADLGSEQRTRVEYDEFPQVLIDAVVATEDARFFEHSGIDLRRIGGAIIANIRGGFGSEGASTITQQVVEQSFLTPDKDLSIKVQEQWLALQLEREYSKEEIMEMYLNKIFYGSRAYGVGKASEVYFDKTDLEELTLPEAAILAGLPQRPTAYNPYESPELTEGRMDTVLTLMVRHDKISQEEADEARGVDITELLNPTDPEPTHYEAFLQQVRDEVEEKVDGADIYTDGLEIHTTLDPSIQEHVEFLLTDSEENPIPYYDEEMQASMAVLDTNNGAIRAIGGSRNNQGLDGFNYATDLNRQPGSTIKPIVSYGPAIEHDQISTYQQINDDQPYEVQGTDPIRNYNRSYAGWVSARDALSRSLNVPAVKVLEETGYENAQTFAEGLGINFADDNIGIRDAIGGTETGVSPLQLAGAFRAFGNEGIYNEPYAVTSVEFADGRSIDLQPEPEAAMSDYTAYMISDMLKTAISEGTGTNANIQGMPVAGKTGTTNRDGIEGAADSWFSGYTTNYTISAWTGYDEYDRGIEDTQIPHALFRETMTEISNDIETADFTRPSSVVEVDVERGSNPAVLPSDYTPSSEIITELFVSGTEPSSTSERFDQLDSVSGLHAEYDEDSNSITVEWDYDTDTDVSFEVSASQDGGQMQGLSSTDDTSIEISDVESGTEYEIQVVALSNEDSGSTSDPVSTAVTVPGEDDEEEEGIPSVNGLSASYNEGDSLIDVSWQYDGPPASFEVDVNGETQTVDSNGIEISGATPGETYTINVTPVGQNGDNEGVRGDTQSTEITVPEEEVEEEQEPEEEQGEEEEQDEEVEEQDEQEPEEEEQEEENENDDNGEDD